MRRTHRRTFKGFAALLPAAALGVAHASNASATICPVADLNAVQASIDNFSYGIDGRLSTPSISLAGSDSDSQVLAFVAAVPQPGGCGGDCQIQAGNIRGRIGNPTTGGGTTNGSTHPYVEAFGAYSNYAYVYNAIPLGGQTRYKAYPTARVDSNGNHEYAANFDNLYPSAHWYGNLGTTWLPSSSTPFATSQAENANFTSGHPCPAYSNQLFGANGDGYHDAGTHLTLYRLESDLLLHWREWTPSVSSPLSFSDAPYSFSQMHSYGAWKTGGS